MRTESKSGQRGPFLGRFGLILLAVTYLGTSSYVLWWRSGPVDDLDDNVVVLRVAHNFVERDTQLAIRELADRYEARNPGRRVIIYAVPERMYPQWLTTQLRSDTPPDLFQVAGRSDWTTASIFQEPLTGYVGAPNPYNEGTELEGVPWRETYIDGMEGGYYFNLLEFYGVPLALNTSRLFYNKTLLREITGLEEPPSVLSDWLFVCEQIRRHSVENGLTISPVAASRDTDLYGRYFPCFTDGMMDPLDVSSAGTINGVLTFFGLYTGSFDLHEPRIRAAFDVMRRVAQCFQAGFVSATPEQIRFQFLQEQSVMVVGNVLDVTLFKAAAPFEVGVVDFPMPTSEDPLWGQYFLGPPFEESITTFCFGLSRTSPYQEEALDFMQFCTSQENNAEFCRAVKWHPAIKGSATAPELEVFRPKTEGLANPPDLNASPQINIYFAQNFPLFLSGRLSFDEFMEELKRLWLSDGRDWLMRRRDQISRKNLIYSERTVARSRVRMLFEEAGELKPGQAMSEGTQYELGLQILLAQFGHGFGYRNYIWDKLRKGEFTYPPPSESPPGIEGPPEPGFNSNE